jgi:hypothetical protein
MVLGSATKMAKMARIAPMMTGVFQVGVTDEV